MPSQEREGSIGGPVPGAGDGRCAGMGMDMRQSGGVATNRREEMNRAWQDTKGFTLVELVIVILIIAILAAVSVPIYKSYVRRSMASEGRALVGAVANAERIYFSSNSSFFAVSSAGFDSTLDIDARMNRYFTQFSVSSGNNQFTVTTTGTGDAAGITVTLTQSQGAQPTVAESGI